MFLYLTSISCHVPQTKNSRDTSPKLLTIYRGPERCEERLARHYTIFLRMRYLEQRKEGKEDSVAPPEQ